MKTVILAGGLGTRLAEETRTVPKPMVEIGGIPILRHIMAHYASYGHEEFVIALGYKGEVIKNHFMNYHSMTSDFTVDLNSGLCTSHRKSDLKWKVSLIDTGASTQTGGRLLRLRDHIGSEPFFVTYGDGVSNVDLDSLLAFHKQSKRLVTVTAVRPPARFGALSIEAGKVIGFKEKPHTGEGWINGGFFVMEPEALDYIASASTPLEESPLEQLVIEGELSAYCHHGFWHPMDTLRDKQHLEELWNSGKAPWNTRPKAAIGIAA